MGWSACEITMTEGAWRVNGEAWDEGCCCTAGEARAGRWSCRLGILTAKRDWEAHARGVGSGASMTMRPTRQCGHWCSLIWATRSQNAAIDSGVRGCAIDG